MSNQGSRQMQEQSPRLTRDERSDHDFGTGFSSEFHPEGARIRVTLEGTVGCGKGL
jgi:hypothetical protein